MRACVLLAVALVVAACEYGDQANLSHDAPIGGGDGPRIDGPRIDAPNGTPDARVGVQCGAEVCTGQQDCCVPSGNPMAMCVDQGNCTGAIFVCDGPEDCNANQVCCVGGGGGDTVCRGATQCNNTG